MEIVDAIPLFFERGQTVFIAWNIYAAGALGVLGLVGATVKTSLPVGKVKWVLTFGFLVFALSNVYAIHELFNQQVALLKFATDLAERSVDSVLIKALCPWVTVPVLYVFHLTLDIAVVAAIWVMPKSLT